MTGTTRHPDPLTAGADEIRALLRAELARIQHAQENAQRPLTLNAAARRLSLSKPVVSRLIEQGKIRTIPWVGKRTRFLIPVAEIDRIQRLGIPQDAPPPRQRGRRVNKAAADAAQKAADIARVLNHPVEK